MACDYHYTQNHIQSNNIHWITSQKLRGVLKTSYFHLLLDKSDKFPLIGIERNISPNFSYVVMLAC